jgi:tRNA threonylcarbamoyladenosine biosynthesis protein TsaE
VIHFDFYRVTTLKEIIDIGFEEYINSDAICLIEWAENAQALLPPRRFEVRLELGKTEDTRTIMIGEENEVAA